MKNKRHILSMVKMTIISVQNLLNGLLTQIDNALKEQDEP